MRRYSGLLAAVLAGVTAAVHIFVGTPEVQGPLFASSLDIHPALLLFVCWHLVSCTLVLSAGALFWAARPGNAARSGPLVVWLSLAWLSFGLVFVVVALAQPGPGWLLILPQWTLLLPVGALGLWSVSGRRA